MSMLTMHVRLYSCVTVVVVVWGVEGVSVLLHVKEIDFVGKNAACRKQWFLKIMIIKICIL